MKYPPPARTDVEKLLSFTTDGTCKIYLNWPFDEDKIASMSFGERIYFVTTFTTILDKVIPVIVNVKGTYVIHACVATIAW